MKSKNWSAAVFVVASLAAGLAQAVQTVNFTNILRNSVAATNPVFVASGDVVKFDASLVANGASGVTSGLGLCLNFNTAVIGTPVTTTLFANQLQANGAATALGAACTAGGGTAVAGANTQIIKGWADSQAVGWPTDTVSPACTATSCPAIPLPVKLYTATITMPGAVVGSSLVGFAASSVSTGETFSSNTPLTFCGMPTVAVAKTADGSEVGPTAASFSVTLSAAVPAACGTAGSFPVTLTLGGTAAVPGAAGADYAISGTNVVNSGATVTVNFPADGAATTTSVVATPVVDSLFEGTETVTLTVAAGSGNYGGVAGTASANIADNGPTVTITSSVATIPDNGASATITVNIGGNAPAGGFSVPLTLPAANARFTTTCATPLVVAAGSATGTCTVTAVANTTANDGNVPLAFSVNCAATCTNGTPATANVSVIDDDIPVITAAASPATLTDSAGQVSTVTFSTTIQSASPLTINFTPPAVNARYTLSACTSPVTLPANTSSVAGCTVTAVANTTLGDGSATATTTVLAGTGYNVGSPAAAIVTVNNDDLASISVAVSPASVVENSGTPLVFTFTASAAAPSTTAIAFTPPAASSRYSTTCVSPITLPASATTVTCSVTPINNTAIDGSVTATVTVLASAGVYAVGTPSAATGTITDDDIGLGVTASVGSVDEGGTATFILSCTGVGSATVSYSFSGTYAPLPAGASTTVTCGTPASVSVPTLDDSVVNGTRSLTLTITSVTPISGSIALDPARASATVSILDNDRPTVIPTMSTLGVALLGLLLAGIAGFSVRRRRF